MDGGCPRWMLPGAAPSRVKTGHAAPITSVGRRVSFLGNIIRINFGPSIFHHAEELHQLIHKPSPCISLTPQLASMPPKIPIPRAIPRNSPQFSKNNPPKRRPPVFPHPRSRHEIEAWQSRFRQVRAGSQKSALSVLEERGYVKDIAG